jgi:hypothetical protein
VSTAERRYRRLLAWYPRDHRERNGEEMLGVLLAGSSDRRGPRWRETVDLLWGAVRMHLRRVVGIDGGVDPRDVLAIVSLLAPVAMLAAATYELYELGAWARYVDSRPWTWVVPSAELGPIFLAVAVLALVGLRRIAAAGAWLGTAGLLLTNFFPLHKASNIRWWTGEDSGWVLLGLVTAVALTWSPGPARGRELVGRWAVAVMGAAVVATMAIGYVSGLNDYLPYGRAFVQSVALAPFVIGAVVAAGPRSRVGRRAAVLLLLPAMTLVPAALYSMGYLPEMSALTAGDVSSAVEMLVFGTGPVAVVVLALGLPSLIRRRADKHVA